MNFSFQELLERTRVRILVGTILDRFYLSIAKHRNLVTGLARLSSPRNLRVKTKDQSIQSLNQLISIVNIHQNHLKTYIMISIISFYIKISIKRLEL